MRVKAKGNAYKLKEGWLLSQSMSSNSDWFREVISVKDCLKAMSFTQFEKYTLDINF